MKPLTEKQRALHAQAKRRYARGDYAGAADLCRQILRKHPAHPEILFDLAQAQMRRERFADAEQALGRLLKASPGSVTARVALALCYRDQGNIDRALAVINEALARRQAPDALRVKAELYHIMGDFEGACDVLAPLVEAGSAPPGIAFEHARLCARLDRLAEARSRLEDLVRRDDVPPATRSDALFELAAVCEAQGEYDRAWATCVEANDLQEDRFDPAGHEAMVARVIAAWSADAVAGLPAARVKTDVPVFVLGMPRSGTTLVEQILASHPEVHGAGELPRIAQLVAGLQPHEGPGPAYIDDLSVLTPAAVDRAARDYLKTLRAHARTARRVTDKQVFNFLYLGPIRVMFPDAPVIHCVRDPRDVAVSCYFQSFMGRVHFANRLAHIGVFSAAYTRLMDHWASVLTGPQLEVRYEDLVDRQEQVSRQLVEFAGLPWDDACLRFHETKRAVRTASIDQVRRPIYRSSVGRWRHYAGFMGSELE
jgi:Flp pilus assembly protein TadD